MQVEQLKKFYDMGFSLIPVGNDKKPLIAWEPYKHKRADWVTITGWMNEYVVCNWGAICGAVSGGLVIGDCDDPHISSILTVDTLTIKTPSGGLHLYFKSKVIPEKAQAYKGFALDIQGEKAYAIIPPSRTEKGEYTIIKDRPIKEIDNVLEFLDTKLKSIAGDRGEDLQRFKESVGTAIIERWVKKEYEGHNYWTGNCPFHSDKDPSFTVYDNGYYCFGCGEHGDVIDFVMKIERIDFKAALSRLSEITGVKVPELRQTSKAHANVLNGAFAYVDRIIEDTPIYYDTAHNYWLWDEEDSYYKAVDETQILLTILQNIADPAIIQSKFKQELLEAVRLRGRDARVKEVPATWIHLKNTVIDIKTGEKFNATPEYLFTEPIPHNL